MKQQYDRQVMQAAGPQTGLEAIGPPNWSRPAWESFKATVGRYPSIREGDLPNMSGAPDWAYELQGLRPPPVSVTTGSGSVGGMQTDPYGVGSMETLRGRRR